MSTRSPKRQRITGSFSPASPPYHLEVTSGDRKEFNEDKLQTPLSPPNTTLTSQNQTSFTSSISDLQNSSPSIATHTQVGTLNSYAQTQNVAIVTVVSAKGLDGAATMVNFSEANTRASPARNITIDEKKHLRTDHERHIENDELQKDNGDGRPDKDLLSLYNFRRNFHPSSRPLASENLISLYRLDRVAASVARKDPVTGEKINKLRKSYEGKVKALQLAGKNKAISKSDEFSNMLNYPDEEWFNQKVFGKNVEDGLPASILAKLDKAVQASPGSLPAMDSNKWKSIIGADEPPTVKPADLTARKPSQGLQVLSESGSSVQNTVMSSRPLRPERTGKKRSYVDSSFKGYGEGFLDDDIVGTSAGEEDSRSSLSKKKRRKVSTEDYSNSVSLGLGDRGSSLGVGMVGMGPGTY